MVYSVGLTGNIACGKSTAARMFSELGVEVYSADAVSRELTQAKQPAYQHIVQHFGQKVLLKAGDLDRNYLRDRIFSDSNERAWLEQLLHPLIRNRLAEQVYNSKSIYCLVEIPLLFEPSMYPYLNHTLLITSSPELQLRRVMKRDQCSKEKALAILATQPSMEERLKHADYMIHNDGEIEELRLSLEKLHEEFTLKFL